MKTLVDVNMALLEAGFPINDAFAITLCVDYVQGQLKRDDGDFKLRCGTIAAETVAAIPARSAA